MSAHWHQLVLFGVVTAFVMMCPVFSRAEARSTELRWRTPPDAQCATGEDMLGRVARLSDQLLTLSGGQQTIDVVVSPHGEHWQAVLRLVDHAGRILRTRSVEGRAPHCGSIEVAAAVVIATMLDSMRADSDTTQVPSRPAPPSDRSRMAIALFGAASPGLVPSAWLGGGVAFEAGSLLQLALSAVVYPPSDHLDALGRGARLWGAHAGFALCPAVLRGRAAVFRACGGAQAGAVFASGIGLTRSEDTVVPLLLATAGAQLSVRITERLALRLALTAAGVLLRPSVSWGIEGESDGRASGERIAVLVQMGITISL